MTYLLDINCLVALFDGRHVNHEAAHAWFGALEGDGWSSCPLTENGIVRVLSSPAYPTVTATPNEVIDHVKELIAHTRHEFWPDEVSILNLPHGVRPRLQGPGQITDLYLLLLAIHKGGELATFDGSFARTMAETALGRSILVIPG